MTTALYLLDTVLNSAALLLALRFSGKRIQLFKVLFGAFFGACFAGWMRALALSRMHTAMLWLPCAMVMMMISAGDRAGMGIIRGGLLLLCAYGLLGGVIQALWGASGSLPAAWCLGCAAVLWMAQSVKRGQKKACDTQRVTVAIEYRGRTAEFDAVLDSGNTLRDYLTHLPVIVLPMADGREKLEPEGMGLRPIFAETAGGKTVMHCFTPHEVVIQTGGKVRRLQAAAALSPLMKKGLPALVPTILFEDDQNG
ncbi:MAG: sigma-E processing peptidase SpoIIGA [Clostridia bacterium]|nr:sigma-E processing peptidase SpoIIGA [Clostridia bacterium]